MIHTEDPSVMLDALSERVLRHLSVTAWRKLFLQNPRSDVMHFEHSSGTLLCAELPGARWRAGAPVLAELSFLANCYGGHVDPCPPTAALIQFDEPTLALDMALQLQEVANDTAFQVGIVTGSFTTAVLRLDGKLLRMLVGAEVTRAAAVARLATAGTIRMGAESYLALQDNIARVPAGVISTEYEDDQMTAVSLTLAPRSTAYLSTFAGLGLT